MHTNHVFFSVYNSTYIKGKSSPERESSSAGSKTSNFDATNDAGESLMDRVMSYCRTRDFLKIFEDYILNHLKFFKGADLDEAGEPEHRLEWYDIFQDYLKGKYSKRRCEQM